MAEAVHRAVGTTILRNFHTLPGLSSVKLPPGMALKDAIRSYRRQPGVLYAEPDYILHATATPNDPYFSNLWALQNTGQIPGAVPGADIHATQAWDITTGSSTVVVGVLDTGIDYTHPDLVANVYRNEADCNNNGIDDDGDGYIDDCYGIDTFNHDSDPMDDYFHGTHVSGIIGASGNNSLGVVGVNWNVKLFACKFLDSTGSGFVSGAIECLDYFALQKDRGVNIVATNNSYGGYNFSQAFADAIDQHRQRGILFIAAAGNLGVSNETNLFYPADFTLPNIISVAASDQADILAPFSDFGPTTVALAAPGVGIMSTSPGGNYMTLDGTSMAAPLVTGVAALLAAQDPTRNATTIRNLILTGADPVSALADKTLSGARLDALNALTCSNRLLRHRVQPRGAAATVPLGQSLTLERVSINCGQSVASEQVQVTDAPLPGCGGLSECDQLAPLPPGEGGTLITLRDDGVAPDTYAGDGLLFGQFTPSRTGLYTLRFPGGDPLTVSAVPGYSYAPDAYTWRTITGTNLQLGINNVTVKQLALPFPVQFGGAPISSLNIGLNGIITPDNPIATGNSQPLPTGDFGAGAIVAPFWDWFSASGTASDNNVFYDTVGTAPNREFVVEWRNVTSQYCLDPAPMQFQVVFSESSSDVLFNYASVQPDQSSCSPPPDNGAQATVGIQLRPDNATQFSHFTPSLSNRFALRWSMVGDNPAPMLTAVSPGRRAAGTGPFTIAATGAGFVSGSQLLWNGSPRPTNVLNAQTLTATISATDVSAVGSASITINNPPPAGGRSNSLMFSITALGTLTVTSPNGGELWVTGTTQLITWSYTNDPGDTLRIDLMQGNALYTTIADGVSVGAGGQGSFSWAIPSSIANATGYLVKVTSDQYLLSVADGSDAAFAIRPPFWLQLTAPSGGEQWAAGSMHTISWQYTPDQGPNATLQLREGTAINPIATVPVGSNGVGSYSWTIPMSQPPASDYQLFIGTACCSSLSATFTITSHTATATQPDTGTLGISPHNPHALKNSRLQFTVWANGQTVSEPIQWDSSTTSVATIDTDGIATLLSPGSTTITATLGTSGAQVSTVLTVAAAPPFRPPARRH